ncbi:MAG: flagellar protein FlgN [Hyphomicrobium sp.]|uniref:flagellar protein FlgN n=1 Tax=Hyphomicrobium sp. TaxID=82 RepID=UPI003D0DCAA0
MYDAPALARSESAPGAVRGTASHSTVAVSIQRLEEIVDQETLALRTRKAINLKDFNDRKSQALLELTRSLKHLEGAGPDPALAARVGALKVKLAVNQAALRVHLEAVREVSATISDALRQAESDGTYTQAISSAPRRP